MKKLLLAVLISVSLLSCTKEEHKIKMIINNDTEFIYQIFWDRESINYEMLFSGSTERDITHLVETPINIIIIEHIGTRRYNYNRTYYTLGEDIIINTSTLK